MTPKNLSAYRKSPYVAPHIEGGSADWKRRCHILERMDALYTEHLNGSTMDKDSKIRLRILCLRLAEQEVGALAQDGGYLDQIAKDTTLPNDNGLKECKRCGKVLPPQTGRGRKRVFCNLRCGSIFRRQSCA